MVEVALDKITKIETHRYTLKPRSGHIPLQSGVLVRVSFSDLPNPGVSDLFPWSEELATFFKNRSSKFPIKTRVTRSLEAARDEAIAVFRNVPLINGSVMNHAISLDPLDLAVFDIIEARRATFPAIKIKIGKHDARTEAAALSRLVSHWGIRLRLDANERMTRDQLMIFLDSLPIRIRESIEFIEDPFAFEMNAWRNFHSETGIAVAYDCGARSDDLGKNFLGELFENNAAQILVHKPAWQDDERVHFAKEKKIPVLITSILGHPVGNIWAAAKAAELAPEGVHGTMSHVVYREDEASKVLIKSRQARGSRMVGIGVGLGLQSKWFNRLKWETIS